MKAVNNYLLKTPGRTGSHIILSYFAKNDYKIEYTFDKDATEVFKNVNKNTNIVIHDHSFDIPLDTESYHLILNKRTNLFDLGISSALALLSNNFGGKPANKNFKTELHPGFLSKRIFLLAVKQHYYDLIINDERHIWKSVIEINYEDIINDYEYISKRLGNNVLDKTNMLTYPSLAHKPSVTNYDILLKEFNKEKIFKISELAKNEATVRYHENI